MYLLHIREENTLKSLHIISLLVHTIFENLNMVNALKFQTLFAHQNSLDQPADFDQTASYLFAILTGLLQIPTLKTNIFLEQTNKSVRSLSTLYRT